MFDLTIVNSWTEVGTLVAVLWGVRRNRTGLRAVAAVVAALVRGRDDVDDELAQDVLELVDDDGGRSEA